MALSPGTRIGAYEIGGSLGAGGMGEVYRATDTNLKRQVAIKVLPEAVAADAERLARFQREAEVLASLNHPNIAGIYGIESGRALVMELVEGPTLADRISEGAIPVDDALLIARQIADALEAAHEQGIIHRDLKPANIKVRPDGTVKVLDFGLAKAMETGTGMGDRGSVSLSPTLTSPAMMTGVGMILGTAAYMSPEQARGKTVDRRADIWAFGVVLYEMLTGRRAFEDEDVSLTLSKVLQREPDFDALPPSVPARVSQVLRLCLRKDVKQRAGDIRDVRLALEGAFETVAPQAAALPDTSARGRVARVSVVALLAGAAIAATATWFAMRPDDPAPPRVSRLPFVPPATAALTLDTNNRDLTMAPDGSRFAYVGNRGTQIFVRALDALEPVPVFTGSPRAPFVSPDGQWIGFAEADALRKVAVTGGPAVTVAMLDGAPRGATWGSDETIVFATANRTTGLQRVSAGGGKIEVLTRPDRAQGESDHLWPDLLPGGRAVLFTIVQLGGGLDTAQIVVLDLQTKTRKVLVRGGSHARYVSSGHLVYGAAGTLRAVAFDLATLATRGTPVPVVPDVVVKSTGGVDAAMADDGTLAYVQGAAAGGDADRTLVWVDRSGREVPLDLPAGRYLDPELSPDGSRIALAADAAGNLDVWVIDIADGRRRRITFGPAADRYPLWTPDGKALVFMSARDGVPAIYRKGLDADLAEEKIFGDPTRTLVPWSWSADGQTLVMSELAVSGSSGYDVGALTLSGKAAWKSLLGTAFLESQPVVSPDGKWMAYSSNEGGTGGIYVRPFPDVTAGVEQVSTEGGNNPVWPRDGRQLLYRNGNEILSVAVELSPTFRPRTPEVLFMGTYFDETGTQWDVTRDGKRLLMLKPVASDDAQVRQNQIVVVQNWTEELKRLVPVK